MEILQHTQGIDPKATNSELHGSVVIQLFDKDTDKLVEEVKHDNFFTNALADIVGGAPYMQNMLFKNTPSYSGISHNCIEGMYNDLLGGIILFPQTLGASMTDYFPSFTNFPTAYAAMNSYELTDPKQGTFDPTSAAIANGYQYIYNWGANNGNGTINSVALSNKDCYKYYSEPTINYIPNIVYNNAGRSYGYYGISWFPRYNGNKTAHGVLAADEDGIIMFGMTQPSWDFYKTLYYIPLKPYSLNFTNSVLNINNNLEEFCSWKYTGTWGNIRPTVQMYEGKIAVILREDGANKPCTITLLNKADGSVYDTITVTWADINMSGSSYRYALVDGYIYASSYNTNGIMYKCSISDPTDIETIELANVGYRSGFATPTNSNKIFHSYYIIEDGVVLPLNTMDPISSYGSDHGSLYTLAYMGPWVVTKVYDDAPMVTHIDPHYCATKNNLATAITKDNTKAMKVTYTVTQQ